ncbi:MAG: hypothetical protein HOE90_17135 [Bacteriovoracaceae bacterium]|nr:hypothetical protein [Bacteriovoracaceae bacterium]
MSTSISDFQADFAKIFSSHKRDNSASVHLLTFLKDTVGSGIWVSRAAYKTFTSLFYNPLKDPGFVDCKTHNYIVGRVASGKKIPKGLISSEQIFRTIFNEIQHTHIDPTYKSLLDIPETNSTIVLVPGMLNELYKTHAFERAAKHLHDTYGIEYITPKVSGRKGASFNANLLGKQLADYVKENPKRKLWLIAYSKGGIDCLHFMKKFNKFSEKHIIGISTIACPIMGSMHMDQNPLLKALVSMEVFQNSRIYQSIDKGRDLLGIELQKTVSHKKQTNWFRRNHKGLPKKPFYTSLALNSHWYDAHAWMALTKLIFRSNHQNDGIVDTEMARFPDYFESINFGITYGHHLIGARSSFFNQEALIEAHLITLKYLKKIK